jgi:hypothetical protein
MRIFLYFCGWFALLAYALSVAVGLKAEPVVIGGNPLFLIGFVTAFGLSRIIEVLEQIREKR